MRRRFRPAYGSPYGTAPGLQHSNPVDGVLVVDEPDKNVSKLPALLGLAALFLLFRAVRPGGL